MSYQDNDIARGWGEAAVAWRVCASLHEQYAKGRDTLYATRQLDFYRHGDQAKDMQAKLSAPADRSSINELINSLMTLRHTLQDSSDKILIDKTCVTLAALASRASRAVPPGWIAVPIAPTHFELAPLSDSTRTPREAWETVLDRTAGSRLTIAYGPAESQVNYNFKDWWAYSYKGKTRLPPKSMAYAAYRAASGMPF